MQVFSLAQGKLILYHLDIRKIGEIFLLGLDGIRRIRRTLFEETIDFLPIICFCKNSQIHKMGEYF